MLRWLLNKMAGPVEYGISRSKTWNAVKTSHLEKHPTCEACGSKEKLNVHHKIPFHLDPSREEDPTNLITLCEGEVVNCHLLFGHGRDWKAYNPEVVSDCQTALLRLKTRKYTL